MLDKHSGMTNIKKKGRMFEREWLTQND